MCREKCGHHRPALRTISATPGTFPAEATNGERAAASTGLREWLNRCSSSDEEGLMTSATLTSGNVRVRDEVMRQLEWDPAVDASGIGVTARDGAVTLTGYIDSYT